MRFRTKTPHVEQDWAGDFVVTLRLRDVAGSAIGSALAEVDAHCADSGQDARSAFGDPTAYAGSLDFGAQARPLTRRALARPVLTAAVGVLGMLATLWGDEALRHGRGVVLTVGMFVGLAVLAAALGWLWFDTDRVLRLLVRRPFWGWALLMGHLALMVVAFNIGTQVPAMPTLAVGILLLVVASAIQWREFGSNRDPVQGPAEAGGVGGNVKEPTPASAALTATLMYPVVTLVFIAVNRLIGA